MDIIGFDMTAKKEETGLPKETTEPEKRPTPVRSLAKISFDGSQKALVYYNDRFDLKAGDFVFVQGRMEGRRGRVISLCKTFKIRLSDYKRVIGVADRSVKGRMYFGGSHLFSFDRSALPYEKVLTWMKPPEPEKVEYVGSNDRKDFPPDDRGQLHVCRQAASRGVEYYRENRVCFLELDGQRGRALVEGAGTCEVEFTCEDGQSGGLPFGQMGGQSGGLPCDCCCTCTCKHEVAVMLQLSETLKLIGEQYAEEYAKTGYFSAVSRQLFFTVAATGQERGSMDVEV